MISEPQSIPVGEVAQGTHLSLSYSSLSEQLDVLVPFVRDGLARNERVLYVADPDSEATVATFGEAGIRALANGQLVVENANHTYLHGGYFEAERMIEHYSNAVSEAVRKGFAGARIAANMRWAAGFAGMDDLIEYERTLDGIFDAIPASVICQYDRRSFLPEVIADLESAHRLHARPNVLHDSKTLQIVCTYDPFGIAVFGEVDIACRAAFRDAVDIVLATGEDVVLLDLRHATYIDAASIEALMRLATSPGAPHTRLIVPKNMIRMFQVIWPSVRESVTLDEAG